jgi:hypothetical protein
LKDIEQDLLKKVDYALCKCHAKYLMAQHENSSVEVKEAKTDI